MDPKRRIPYSDEEVIAAYAREKVARKVAAMLGIGETTVGRVLAKHGVDASGGTLEYRRRARLFDDATASEIRRRYESGESTASLIGVFGGSFDSVKRAIKRAGGTLRDNPAPLETPAEIAAIAAMYEAGVSQQGISLKLGRSQSFVARAMKRHGIARRDRPSGDQHGRWKGGEWLTGEGYVRTLVSLEDPLASMRDRSGYVLKHRLVMARSLGRPLDRYETVHHINGDPTDNRIENLQLRQGRHGKGIVMRCRSCGSHDLEPTPLSFRA